MIEKILNLLVLDPIEDFSPKINIKVILPIQLITRCASWIILLILFINVEDVSTSLFRVALIILVAEITWSGLSTFDTLEALLAHLLAVITFVITMNLAKSYLMLLGMLLSLMLVSKFDIKDLLINESIDRKTVIAWRSYHERQNKFWFFVMGTTLLLLQKLGIFA